MERASTRQKIALFAPIPTARESATTVLWPRFLPARANVLLAGLGPGSRHRNSDELQNFAARIGCAMGVYGDLYGDGFSFRCSSDGAGWIVVFVARPYSVNSSFPRPIEKTWFPQIPIILIDWELSLIIRLPFGDLFTALIPHFPPRFGAVLRSS